MATFEENVDNLLSKIERELIQFVAFIENMEHDYDNLSSGKRNARHFSQPNSTTSEYNNTVDHENKLKSSAVTQAFHIVENFLLRMSNLLDQFASLTTADEQSIQSNRNQDVTHYYLQYVYRIASDLATTIQEHLGHFSDKLDELASPLSSDEDEKIYPSTEKNTPTEQDQLESGKRNTAPFSRVKSQPPTNLQRLYERPHVGQYIHEHLRSPKLSSSDTEDEEDNYQHFERVRHKKKLHENNVFQILTDTPTNLSCIKESLRELSRIFHALHLRIVKQGIHKIDIKRNFKVLVDSTKDLSRTVELLQELVNLFQTIYSRISRKMEHAHTEFPSTFHKRIHIDVAIPYGPNINQGCCSVICDQCCEFCKLTHMETQKKGERERKESSFVRSTGVKESLRVPFWLHSEAKQTMSTKNSELIQENNNKGTKVSTEISHTSSRKRTTKNRGTQTSLKEKESLSSSEDLRKFDKLPESSNSFTRKSQSTFRSRKEDVIVPGKATKQISTGQLRRSPLPIKVPPSRKRKALVKKDIPIRLKSYKISYTEAKEETDSEPDETFSKMKKSDQLDDNTESNLKPLFLRDITEKIVTITEFGGFCLFPGINNSTSPDVDNLVETTEESDEHLSRGILFDIEKFSTLLKEKFKAHLKQSIDTSESDEEPTIVLDIVFDSLGEATNFIKGSDERASHECDLDNEAQLMKGVVNFVKQAQVTDTEDKPRVKKDLKLEDIIVTKDYEKKDPRKLQVGRKQEHVLHYCCRVCQNMIDPVMCTIEGTHICNEKCLIMKSLKECCLECGHGCQRGLTIHQCHDHLPEGILEVRHMDNREKICVCYLFWNRKEELGDWRWQKNPFHDPTRVEIEQDSNFEKDAILKVIFGPEGTMIKESLAETHLQTVCDSEKYPELHPKKNSERQQKVRESGSWESNLPTLGLFSYFRRKSTSNRLGQLKKPKLDEKQQKLLTKVGRFFDDVQKVGYGKGPPLVLKLRKKRSLFDAYDLLTVPSNIRLNYYRSLRILFVDDFDSETDPSSTNFQYEDKIDKLFKVFEERLFCSPEKCLFLPPSEETQCLYFNPHSNTHPQWFTFAGIVLALAILHEKKLDVMFPICLFKLLLDRPVNIEDLKEIEPLVYQKLMWMKETDISTGHAKMNFTIKDRMGNKVYENELMVNGSKIAVTEKNKFRFIDLVVKWKLAERCLSQLNDFRAGFASVIDPAFLSNFTEKELRLLIRNPPDPIFFIRGSRSNEDGNLERRGTY